jgi:hypothetical protein
MIMVAESFFPVVETRTDKEKDLTERGRSPQ